MATTGSASNTAPTVLIARLSTAHVTLLVDCQQLVYCICCPSMTLASMPEWGGVKAAIRGSVKGICQCPLLQLIHPRSVHPQGAGAAHSKA
jgi:hypothetical protein